MPKALWRVGEATDSFTSCLRCSHVHPIRVQLLLVVRVLDFLYRLSETED